MDKPPQVIKGDALAMCKDLPSNSVHCCVTSPPYWQQRDYGVEGQLGLEATPGEFVDKLVSVFAEVRRILRPEGTFWLNIGDSYVGGGKGGGGSFAKDGIRCSKDGTDKNQRPFWVKNHKAVPPGTKNKDLVGIPWLLAFALRSEGWYLRSEITWCKKVPMPESVKDRPTSATEKIFLFSKSRRYHYDAAAVRNPPSESFANDPRWQKGSTTANDKSGYLQAGAQNPKGVHRMFDKKSRADGSNMRNFWLLGPEPYSGEHYATFPSEIPRRAILAGCPVGGIVLDPFAGSGTTGRVALELGRVPILIELNPDSVAQIHTRCNVTPGLHL